jgi:hypothetical protein
MPPPPDGLEAALLATTHAATGKETQHKAFATADPAAQLGECCVACRRRLKQHMVSNANSPRQSCPTPWTSPTASLHC